MGKNLIPIIAKELGVSIGEEFKLTHYDTKWRFTENNLQFFNLFGPEEDQGWLNALDETLGKVIMRKLQIIKPPFKPKLGQPYWTYRGDWEPEWELKWCGIAWELMALKAGCVFRTKEEALDARPEKFKELTGKDWKE